MTLKDSIAKRASVLLVASLAVVSPLCLSSSQPALAESEKDSTNNTLHPYNANALHRLDFRVVGKSCAVCLHRMQERMKELPGTVRSEVMLKSPYGAVVVFDSSKVRAEKILEKCKEGVPEVNLVDVKDVAIKKLPLVLVPAAASEAADAHE